VAKPTAYTNSVSIPLPDEAFVQRVIGDGYDPDQALHVVKMFAGTDDMFPALFPKTRQFSRRCYTPLPARPGLVQRVALGPQRRIVEQYWGNGPLGLTQFSCCWNSKAWPKSLVVPV